MPVFSISRQISPEHLIYRLRFDQRFSNYFEDRNTRFWREVFFSEPSKHRVKQLLTFNYLSAEKWKKIDNVSLTSNKLFYIQETDHLGTRWCGSKTLDHQIANRVFFRPNPLQPRTRDLFRFPVSFAREFHDILVMIQPIYEFNEMLLSPPRFRRTLIIFFQLITKIRYRNWYWCLSCPSRVR